MVLLLLLALIGGLLQPVYSWGNPPATCTLYPPIVVQAGDPLSARINSPQGGECTASLELSDPDYLPITWYFDPIECPDIVVAQLFVPPEAPAGDAYIKWQCAGEPSLTCSYVSIQNSNEPGSFDLERRGTVSCMSDRAQALSATTSIPRSGTGRPSAATNALTSLASIIEEVDASMTDKSQPPPDMASPSQMFPSSYGTNVLSRFVPETVTITIPITSIESFCPTSSIISQT